MKTVLMPVLVAVALGTAAACGGCKRADNGVGESGASSAADATGSGLTASGLNGPAINPAPAPRPGTDANQ
ncbi:hypothetical protein CY652_03200 [Burkholderia sp. WAC0059]|uniref:hypothetical protein n=1 Tax=Burkholderia sp. WAC0059 TaxID=2066022 RepID=UPI000C7E8F4A|nr:hypothetical protein [Burkholderia sp. WAC0059]PLZ03989.1 hypothetical protein CY652_03200 [Burkholderia sp. WAC0059]